MLLDSDRVCLLTCSRDQQKIRQLEDAGALVFCLEEQQGRLDLYQVFKLLADQQINNVWVEAGATLNGALMNTELVDEWLVYMAPCILGDQARGLFHLPGLQKLKGGQKTFPKTYPPQKLLHVTFVS